MEFVGSADLSDAYHLPAILADDRVLQPGGGGGENGHYTTAGGTYRQPADRDVVNAVDLYCTVESIPGLSDTFLTIC